MSCDCQLVIKENDDDDAYLTMSKKFTHEAVKTSFQLKTGYALVQSNCHIEHCLYVHPVNFHNK